MSRLLSSLLTAAGRWALPAALAGLGLACASAGAQHYERGQSLQAGGDVAAAHEAFERAASAEPGNPAYEAALATTGEALALEAAERAKARERAGEWGAAGEAWSEAAELDPSDPDYPVRAALSNAKSSDLGVLEWYEAVAVVAEEHPESEIAKRNLEKAASEAYQYHLALGREALARRAGGEALDHFEAAKALDPATPGLSLDDYDEAEARKLAEEAEAKAAEGDAIGAYETYRAAYAKKPLPDIERAMRGVKSRASATLKKLERARALVDRRRFEAALGIFDELVKSGRAPASVVDEAAAVRDAYVREGAEDARRLADRGNLRRALRAIEGIVPHVDLGPDGKDQLRAALALVREGAPADGLEAAERAGLPADAPVLAAVRASAVAEARRQVQNARRIARRDGAKAVTLLAKLSPFEAELPEIETLRRSLRGDAFEDLLAEAVRAARRGDDLEAAAALQAALESGDAPSTLRGPVEGGIAALKAKNYADAERAFREGLAAVPRSRLAREGARVAEIRRSEAEKEALASLRAKSPQAERAVDVLVASFELSPANGAVREARALLEDRLESPDRMSDAEVAATVGWLARLSELDPEARAKVEEGADHVEAGRYDAAESAFAAAGTHPVAQRGQAVARARLVGGLSKSAASDSPAAADAIAALLERDPNDEEGRAALERLLAKAEAAAGRGDDAEAARYLELATRATKPAPKVKAALDRGNASLAAGDVGVAAAAYAEASALAPTSPVPTRAEALAKKLDAEALSTAIESGGLAEARAALKRTLERDPTSEAAQGALGALLDQADAAIAAGRFDEAGETLEVANVATRPEALRAQVTKANTLLGQQNLGEAIDAYDAALELGESGVATRARAAANRARVAQLVAGARALESGAGADLDRSALEVRTLLRQDPTHEAGRAAVAAVLSRAEAAAEQGDGEAVAENLELAATALGQSSVARRMISFVRRGELDEAGGAFGQTAGALKERGPQIVAALRIRSLKSGLEAGGLAAAKNIRDLLRADPNDPTAQKAFDAIVARIEASAKAGEAAAAAAAVREANVASAAGGELSAAVTAGAGPLEEGRFADAEATFAKARAEHPKSEVLGAAIGAARTLRTSAEARALEGLATADDPRVHADALLATRAVDPDAPALGKGLETALARAKQAAAAGDATLLARALAAAGRLEASSSEGAVAMNEAAEKVAEGKLAEAERAFGELRGETAKAAQARIREVRVLRAREAVEKAAKAGDLIGERKANEALLALAPNDRAATARARRLSQEVKSSRLEGAKKQIELGKPGVAWLYLDRALSLDPDDRAAKALKAEVESQLAKKQDLIVVVEAVRREGVPSGVCRKVDPALQQGMMAALSKRTDLNGYVLSEGWTKAWRDGDDRAPDVNGGLVLVMTACTAGSGSGKLTFTWSLESPKGGKVAAEGEITADVDPSELLVDERDGEGKNVRRLLVEESVEKIVEGLKAQGPKVKQWLLTAAEHHLAEKAPEAAANAYARYRMNPVASADPARAEAIESALARAFP